ncbi:MAG: flagellar basal body P-ring protein FlgI [Bryobacteraceae bacterium]
MERSFWRLAFLAALLWLAAAGPVPAKEQQVRLKDLVSIEGVRPNQLVGYGLVVGLSGTGDSQQTFFSAQSLTNMLQRMGVSISPRLIMVRNTAAVMVTATLPPFAQPGTQIDITAGAIGDARSLQGGLLVLTTLRGINGQVFATAQGPLVTGGFTAGGRGNSSTVNHPTVGRIPGGALVERAAPSVPLGSVIHLQLDQEDFTTAARVAKAVNQHFSSKGPIAHADNSALVSVEVPAKYSSDKTGFVAALEGLTIEPDRTARVVINERTGTVVMGQNVHIAPAVIMHGNLTVEIQTTLVAAPPGPFSNAPATVIPETTVNAKEQKARNVVLQQGATVEQLVKALGAIGSTTRDVISILESLRAAGALDAEIEVI